MVNHQNTFPREAEDLPSFHVFCCRLNVFLKISFLAEQKLNFILLDECRLKSDGP